MDLHVDLRITGTITIPLSGLPLPPEPPEPPVPEPPTPEPLGDPEPPASLMYPTDRVVGVNIDDLTYYNTEWPFTNLIRASRWPEGGSYPWQLEYNTNNSPMPALDSDGYPLGLPNGMVLSTLIMRGLGGNYPGGQYKISFDGTGELRVRFDVVQKVLSNNDTFTVNPGNGGILIEIIKSDVNDHVRNIRVYMPGQETGAFNTDFLQTMAPFNTIRYMKWNEVYDSSQQNWTDRTSKDYRTQTKSGVALEWIIELSNKLMKHPWVCVPTRASDSFVLGMAQLFAEKLDPALHVCIEYTNETWNAGLSAYHYLNSIAGPNEDWWDVYARRSVEIFNIWKNNFDQSRLVTVVGTQSVNTWISEQILAAVGQGNADALAIAPYFGGRLGNSLANEAKNWTVDQILDWCENDIADKIQDMNAQKAKADKYGAKLLAYEGGQHLAGVGSWMNDAQLTSLFIAANRHPRMGQLYKDYLNAWPQDAGAFCLFNSTYRPNKYGSWGLLESQTVIDTPKYNASKEVAEVWHGQEN